MDFQEMITELTLVNEEGKEPIYKIDEVQGIVDDYNGKQTKIEELEKQLDEKTKQFEDLKNRVVDSMFNNNKPNIPDDINKPKEPVKPKTFKDLINPDYAVNR